MVMQTAPAETARADDMPGREVIISIRDLRTVFDTHVIHDGIDLDIYRGEVLALVGGSGSGKSTLLREMIMLQTPDSGTVKLFGEDIVGISEAGASRLRRRFGVLFQQGALFSGLTVLQNVGLPLREHTWLDNAMIDELARLKILQAGLEPGAAMLYPNELSGGMIKRAALARAMVLDPEVLFLDEPTSGLDPGSAGSFDELVLKLRDMLGLTVIMVTHDLDSLWEAADRVAVLGDTRLHGVDSMGALSASTEPHIVDYFSGSRARNAQERQWKRK